MGTLQLISWSLKQIRSRFFESLLIVLAIALGVAVISVVGTVYLTGTKQLRLTDPEQNIVTIEAKEDDLSQLFQSGSKTPAIALGPVNTKKVKISLELIDELKTAIPEIKEIVAIERFSARQLGAPPPERYQFEDPYWLNVNWTLPETVEFLGGKVSRGSLYTRDDFINNEPVAVIGSKIAQDLFGDEDPIGKLIEMEHIETPLLVIGVLDEVVLEEPEYYNNLTWLRHELNNTIFSPRQIYDNPERYFSMISLIPKDNRPQFTATIRDYLFAQYGDVFSVQNNREIMKEALKQVKPILSFIGILASLALFIAALNILNLMLARVLKRTRSIGISKALGATKANIFWQFLTESLTLGFLGGLLGLLIVFAFNPILGSLLGGSFKITLSTAFLSIGSSFLVSLIFGIYPALKASYINPVDALRLE